MKTFKEIIIQENIYHKVISKVKETSENIYNKFFNKFKDLNTDEYNTMIRMCYNWFMLNNKYITSNSKEMDLFKKIKSRYLSDGGNIPKKLYRGMTFKTKNDLNNFIKSFEEKKFLYSFKSEKSTKPDYPITSWSGDKEGTQDYFGNLKKHRPEKYSIMMEIDTNLLKNNTILFNIKFLLKTREDRVSFLRMILKEDYLKQDKILKSNMDKNINRFGANIKGALYAIAEDEYLLNKVPFNICKFTTYNEGKEYK